MAKINITTPTGVENLSLLSAFKNENNTYIVFDSEKTGSMGLPIIYISKLTDKLEKIVDPNEWQSVKNYLKGIINGTNFEYIKIDSNLTSDEAFYTPLTLPVASFDTIKNRYVVPEEAPVSSNIPIIEETTTPKEAVPTVEPITEPNIATPPVNVTPGLAPSVEPVSQTPVAPAVSVAMPETPPVTPNPIPTVDIGAPLNAEPVTPAPEINVAPASPIMPEAPAVSNETITSTPITPVVEKTPEVAPTIPTTNPEPVSSSINVNFESDKQTFLKACENMFDALVSKYQKELANLEAKENELKQKETEIATKMQNANEYLANAQAREQVANIAHDNAQKIMDISNLMPSPNPQTPNQTGVI